MPDNGEEGGGVGHRARGFWGDVEAYATNNALDVGAKGRRRIAAIVVTCAALSFLISVASLVINGIQLVALNQTAKNTAPNLTVTAGVKAEGEEYYKKSIAALPGEVVDVSFTVYNTTNAEKELQALVELDGKGALRVVPGSAYICDNNDGQRPAADITAKQSLGVFGVYNGESGYATLYFKVSVPPSGELPPGASTFRLSCQATPYNRYGEPGGDTVLYELSIVTQN
ncbi:MAG: hypothetical protein LBI44_01065 [Oscillospiraceae bacterium]|jgi:hypothetical protein|nr:hypothetical protein [Oscillospiraceae bacterium]